MPIEIRFARPHEEAACLALVPDLAAAQPELFSARLDGALVGAGALVWQSWAKPGGFPLWVHVAPRARRRGIGAALVAAARTAALGETDGLWVHRALADVENEALGFAAACGFLPQRRHVRFEVGTEPFLDFIEPIVARLRRHGRIPTEARIVPLRDAPLDAVARLVAAEFATGPVRALARLKAALHQDDARIMDVDRSTVVIEDGRVVGCLLAKGADAIKEIEANVVAPGARHGYVNALQLATSTRIGHDLGDRRFRFHCDEAVRDTMNLARRSGAAQVGGEALYYAALG